MNAGSVIVLTNVYTVPYGQRVDHLRNNRYPRDWFFQRNYACRAQVDVTVRKANGDNLYQNQAIGDYAMAEYEFASGDLYVLGTSGAIIANGEAASANKGTDFGSLTNGLAVTNRLAITNAGPENLNIIGIMINGAGAAQFRVLNLPSAVQAGTVSDFSLIFQPTVSGVHTAAVRIAQNSTSTPYRLI